jgi:hypothetical protein
VLATETSFGSSAYPFFLIMAHSIYMAVFFAQSASLGASISTRHLLPDESRRAIWVTGFPRSGTSTVLSMVSAGQTVMNDYEGDEKIFSLFEPCNPQDKFAGAGCKELIWQILHCNFTGVEFLHGWHNYHSTSQNTHKKPYSPEGAKRLCSAADAVAFKTVTADHRLENWEWLLDEKSDLRILDVVRDPRGIYASWKSTEPFATTISAASFDAKGMIKEICDVFSDNIDFDNKRVHRVVFEQLVANPKKTVRKAYGFMGMEFGKRQATWITETFGASECAGMSNFTDCHTNSDEAAEKWRSALSQKELDLFAEIESCQRVSQQYGFGSV